MIRFIKTYNHTLGQTSGLPKLFFIMCFSALCQALALVCTLPLLRALIDGEGGSATKWFLIALGLVAVSMVKIPASWSAYKISCTDMSVAQGRIGRTVIKLPLGWFDASSTAKVTSAAISGTNDISHLGPVVLPNLAYGLVSQVVFFVAIVVLDWRIAIPLIIALPILAVLWKQLGKATEETSVMEKTSDEVLSDRILEFAKLQPVLRAAGGTGGLDRIEHAITEDTSTMISAMSKKGTWASLYALGVGIAIAASIATAGWLWLHGSIDAIVFFVVSLWLMRLLEPATTNPLYASEFNRDAESVRRIEEIVSVPPLPEPANPHPPTGTDLALHDVHFGYTEAHPVLNGVTIEIPANSITALVGPSGCGKSTILRLLGRFWDAGQGSVTFGGTNVKDLGTAEVMALTSMVFQDVYLFDTTIAENVRLGRPGATNEDVYEAARKAQLDEIVERLPDGWETLVGEGGRQLSGGERQRVAIARAFLKDAPVLLLDEVTSSLDGANERAVTEAIHQLAAGRTVVMIAHRLSTVVGADQIIVMDSTGHISDRGTHEELKNRSGIYQDFLTAQKAGAAWTLT